MATVNPYLNFNGRCEAAFEHYREVFGGEYDTFQRFSDAPDPEMSGGPGSDLVMHVSLPLGDGQVLMGSDVLPVMPAVEFGTSMMVSVTPDSVEHGQRVFDALADGGTVHMPYEGQFWGAHFGSCTDRFGINWMVNAS